MVLISAETSKRARLDTYFRVKNQNQNHAEPQVRRVQTQAGLWDRRRGHLPENLSCSDYTKCPASLWATLPFCSVKYKRRSGRGRGSSGGVAYQFTTFEFTEPGAGNLLYPRCDPSLGAWIKKKPEKEEEKVTVKVRKWI